MKETCLPKCLIVDDLPENLIALEALIRDEAVEVVTAGSGIEALNLLLLHEFALALLDVQMPEMNGFELAELMRGTEKTRSIPIIFVTAAGADESRIFKGYESGAVDFLHKPLVPMIVKSKVRIFIELFNQKKLLEASLKMRDEFISICSHELNTPLTSLKLQLQILQRKREKFGDEEVLNAEAFLKFLFYTGKSVERILYLVNDMLDVGRVSSGKLSLNLEELNINTLIKEVSDRFCNLMEVADCELTLKLGHEQVLVMADRFRIEQVITNLLTNAAKYAAKKPVEITLDKVLDFVIIKIVDHGPGISLQDQQRIFERFERTNENSSISGLGIGLYISRQIMEMHSGKLEVQSNIGEGSTFVVSLPLKR